MDIKLNERQKKAVTYNRGPLLIVAGAGTGKTRVITESIKRLLKNKKASPKEILALTFTEKAANEMLERLDDVMPLGYEEPYIETFHSFCERVLRREGLEIGLDPNFKTLNFTDSWILFKKNLFKFDLKYFLPLGNPNKFISAILKFFSRLSDEVISADDFDSYVGTLEEEEARERWGELAKLYRDYSALKISQSRLDFGDLITYALRLFEKRKSVLEKYRNQFKHVFVDEFQDTNYAQYFLIKLLAPARSNPSLVVVGDDNQSIYKFRGAAISNILDFKKDYPEASEIILTRNYRSYKGILDASYKLIKNNDPDTLEAKLGISKKLKAERGECGNRCVRFVECETAEKEADFVSKEIERLMSENPSYTYRDFALLARANNHLDPFVSAFKRYKIPYQMVGNRGLFDTPEVKVLISFLRFLVNTSDNASFYHLITSGTFDLDSKNILKAVSFAKKKRSDIFTCFSSSPLFDEQTRLLESYLEKAVKSSTSALLYDFIIKTGYVEKYLEKESYENSLKIKNIDLFFGIIKKFESESSEQSVVSFVEYLDMAMEAGENPAQAQIDDIDTVSLLTVHSAKGLEFPIVFLISLTSDRFPTRNRKDMIDIPDELVKETLPKGDYHLQEERRLFYVGLTRAKDAVFMTYAKNYGGIREKRPSGYILETGAEKEEAFKRDSQLALFQIPPKNMEGVSSKVAGGKTVIPYTSYSQIATYDTCPLRYKYRYILNIPTPPSHALSFGQTIHLTLRDFERLRLFRENQTLDKMYDLYEKNFIDLGYESKEHRERVYDEGKEQLKKYFDSRERVFKKAKFLEKKFRIKIDGIPLIGVIDRVDLVDGGVEIIDYKTGRPKDQAYADKDIQLSVYALAAKKALGLAPKALSLYFLSSGEKISTTRSEEDFDKVREKVRGVIAKIRAGNFEPRVGFHCKYCDFRKICPAYKNYLHT